MSTTKILLALAAGGAVAYLILKPKSASAAPAPTQLPAGWVPPDGATFNSFAPGEAAGIPFAIGKWTWRQPTDLGTTMLIVGLDAPAQDYVAIFKPDAATQQTGILAVGTSPNSGLLAQAAVASAGLPAVSGLGRYR